MVSKKKASKTKATKGKAGTTDPKGTKALADDKIVVPRVAPATHTTEGPEGAELHKAIQSLMGQINKGKDHNVMAFASDVPNTYEVRRPSGIMQLDADTGGGLPAGTLNYLSGPDGSGKSMLLQRYMLMHQKLYGPQASIALAATEGGFDFRRALNIGLRVSVPDEVLTQWNSERLQLQMDPYTEEEWMGFKQQIGAFVLLRGATGEEVMEAMLDSIRSKLFGIVALDSVNALMPAANAEKDVEEENKMAALATLVTKFMARYMPIATGLEGANYTTTIFTAQVRSNPKKAEAAAFLRKYVKDWSATGAWAARHTKSIDITVWNGEKLTKSIGGSAVTIGKETKYVLEKGKHGTHEGIHGSYKYFHEEYLPSGIDDLDTVMIEGMRNGIIREQNGRVSAGNVASGVANLPTLRRMMEIDFDFELAIRREILAARGIMCLYR
jgi:RecA/RadA recombinase